MSFARVRFSMIVFALASGFAPAAGAQEATTPPPAPTAATALTAPPAAAPVTAPDPAVAKKAHDAKAAGRVIDAPDDATVAGCKALASVTKASGESGELGRARVRIALRKEAVKRGASHLRFSDYRPGGTQSETARLFDCTLTTSGEAAAVLVVAPVDGRAPSASNAGTAGTAGSEPVGSPEVAAGVAASASEPGAVASRRSGMAGVQLELIPVGALKAQVEQVTETLDTATTVGLTGSVDFLATPNVSIGFAPGVVFGLKTEDAKSSATEIDLRVRLRAGELVSDGFAAHGYVTVGYSWILPPDQGEMDSENASGLTLGLGAAATYPLPGGRFVSLDVGYQFGNQKVTVLSEDFDVQSNLLRIGVGAGTFF